MLNLLIFIHAVVISVAKLIRKACRRGLNWYWNVPDKDPLEEDLRMLKATTSSEVKNLENETQSGHSRIKRLEISHSG